MLTPQAGIQVDKFYPPTDWQYSFPEGYTRLEYLTFTGTQYIELNFKANQDTRVVTEFSTSKYTANQCIFSSRQSYLHQEIGVFVYSDNHVIRNNYNTTTTDTNIAVTDNIYYKINFDKNLFYVNGQLITTNTYAEFQATYNMRLGRTAVGAANVFYGNLKQTIIFDNGTLIFNLVPAKRNSDNKPGMYDLVNNVFYVNQGTGEFVMGSELYSNNSQIDIRQKNNTNFVEKYKFNENNELVWANPQLNLSGPVNYSVVGSPTIVDNVVSGFGKNNYICINNSIDSNLVEFGGAFQFVTKTNWWVFQCDPQKSFLFAAYGTSNRVLIYSSSSHSISASYTFNTNTKYYYKYIYRRADNTISLYLGIDKQNLPLILTLNNVPSTQKVNSKIIYGTDSTHDLFSGPEIFLNETYIKVNDKLWFYGKNYTSENYAPVPAGLNCKIKGPVSYTEVGTPIVVDGIASGFSANDYLSLTNSQQITSITDFELNIKITTSSIGTKQGVCGIGAGQAGIYIANNGRLHIVALDCTNNKYRDIDMNINLSANTTYYIKNIFRNGNIYGSYSIDGINYTTIQGDTATGGMGSITTLNDYKFGYNVQGSFDGSIDLNETYIKVNNQLWFGYQQVTPSIGYVNTQTQVFIPAPTDGIKYSQTRDIKVIPPEDNTITLLYGTQGKLNLPDEYIEKQYITFTRADSQYIDTGFKANQDTRVEIKFSSSAVSNTQVVFASRDSASLNTFSNVISSSNLRADYNTTQTTIVKLTNNTVYTVDFNKNNFYLDGELKTTFEYANFQSGSNLLIGTSGTANYLGGNIYYCRIYDNGTLIRNLIPCERKSDNVIGFYDLVNDVFYENQGSGTFTAAELKYSLFGLLANVSSGTYDVYIDDVLYATTASKTQTDIDFSTLGTEYVSTGTCTTPEELVLHKIVIKPTTIGKTITKFRGTLTADTTGTQHQGVLWAHFELENGINILGMCNQSATDNWNFGARFLALTAKNDVVNLSTNPSTAFRQCSNLEYVPLLKGVNNITISQVFQGSNSNKKRVRLENVSNIQYYSFTTNRKLEQINIKNKPNTIVANVQTFSGVNSLKLLPVNKFAYNGTSTAAMNQSNVLTSGENLYPTKIDNTGQINSSIIDANGTSSYPMRGLRGLKVSNSAPFTGDTPQINVSYTGLDRDALVELFESMPYNVGYTVVGSPTITDGVVSGFSSSNYLTLPIPTVSNNDFELKTSLIFNEVSSNMRIIVNSQSSTTNMCGLNFIGNTAKLRFNLYNGTTRKYVDSLNSISANTKYYIIGYRRQNIIGIKVSTDNINWEENISIINIEDEMIFADIINIGGTSAATFKGSIDLNETYIKIYENNEWIPWFTGKAARAENPQINITAATGNNLTKVGNVVIDENGVASNLTDKQNYIIIPKSNKDIKTFEIQVKILQPTRKNISFFRINNSDNTRATFNINNDRGVVFYPNYPASSTSVIYGENDNWVYAIDNQLDIYVKINYSITDKNDEYLYVISSSLDGINWHTTKSILSVPIAQEDIWLACSYQSYSTGTAVGYNIDLEQTYVKVNNNYIMKGYLTDNDRLIATNKGWTITG